MIRSLIIFLCLLFNTGAHASKVLNVFNWSDFIPNEVIHQFEEETGIKVNYSTYDSNETLFAKLKVSGSQNYDVIFPSNYVIQRMARQNMLSPLNLSRLSNLKNLDPKFLHLPFDPKNTYSLPYLWSTSAIIVNKKYIDPTTITTWHDLWQPRFNNQIMLLDDQREVFTMGLIVNGHSPNSMNSTEIHAAYQKLLSLLPNVRLFNSIAQINIYIDEDIFIGMGWSGEASVAQTENPNLVYIYPQDGFIIDMDCMAITKNAPHETEAYQFINFLMRPDIAKKVVEFTHFMAPNKPMLELLPQKLRDNQTINPDMNTLKRGIFLQDISETTELYEHYWQRLKVA